MSVAVRDVRIELGADGSVSGRLIRPRGARCLYLVGHGAGAGMDHPFLAAVAERLAGVAVATLRFQFPYVEAGRRRPDSPRRLDACVRAAMIEAFRLGRGLPLVAGGKSMGGRIASQVAAADPPAELAGLIFLGFPLHAAGRPGDGRAAHLGGTGVPMLFLQGTRDALADLDLMRPVCRRLPRTTLHVVEGGDHSFKVLKRSGRTAAEVMDELIGAVDGWLETVL